MEVNMPQPISRKFVPAILSIAILLGVARESIAAERPHLFMDCRPTNLDPKNARAALITREIPRQSLLIAIEEIPGVPYIVRDATAEPTAVALATDIQIGVEGTLNTPGGKWVVQVKLLGANNAVLDETDVPSSWDGAGNVDESVLALKMYDVVRSKWLPLLAKQVSATTMPSTVGAQLASSARIEALLNTIDFHHAFLAARLTHAAITASGESPAQQVVLVRAYANLGESTRHLFNGQSTAFFARALVYADMVTRLEPKLAEGWWARGYAVALFGKPDEAAESLKKGDALAAATHTPVPQWVEWVRSLTNYDTLALFNQIGQSDSGLPSYFAFLTVEHAMLPSLPINYARAALEQNPGAVRLEAVISENGGVGLLHQTTEESPRMLNRMVSQLATDADDPVVRDAAVAALQQQFSQGAIIQLRNVLESQPQAPGQLLPWSTYSSIMRECEFLDAFRRLYFVAYQWGVDPSDEIRQWWPLVADHRYAPLIAAFPAPNESPKPEVVQKVVAINFKDDVNHCQSIADALLYFGVKECPRLHVTWVVRQANQSDRTAWDKARQIWMYRSDADAGNYKLAEARLLAGIAQHHPLVTAEEALQDWKAFAPRAEEVEKKQSQNPIIAYALAIAFGQHNRVDKAISLLEGVVKIAPDYQTYSALASAHLQNNDEKTWQKTYDDYLANVEDLGLDHAFVGNTVAEHFNAEHRYQDALPYAKIAADSYSGWGLLTYAKTLAELHQYDEAARVLAEESDRYGDPVLTYQFCVTTGHGDRAAAAAACAQWFPSQLDRGDADFQVDYAVYLLLEGQPDKADDQLRQAMQRSSKRYIGLLLACRAVEQKKADEAATILDRAQAAPADTAKDRRYDLCIAEFRRCLADPSALPARDGKLVASFADADGGAQRGNSAYIMGRLCELRQKPDDAQWWFRQSLDSGDDNFTCRPLAAEALRRLGEEYFK
jgi:tetratricopeptide (TPR) repeat protein